MPSFKHLPDRIVANTKSNKFRLVYKTQSFTSPVTGFRRSVPLDTRWQVEMNRNKEDHKYWAELESFIDEIQSTSGFFTMWDLAYERPRGIATGVGKGGANFDDGSMFEDGTRFDDKKYRGRIYEAAKEGLDSIIITDLMGDVKPVLYKNDQFSILHGRSRIPTLYKCLSNARSDGTSGMRDGKARVKIAPALRYPVAPNDRVVFFRPRGMFQLVGPVVNTRSIPLQGQARIDAVEAPELIWLDGEA